MKYSLRDYVVDVEKVFDQGLAVPARLRAIADHKRRLLMQDGVLTESQLRTLPGVPYTRNLLYSDPRERFVVVGILWGERSTSPVHDHGTWGVMGVYDNFIRITNFERLDDAAEKGKARLQEKEALIAPRGSVGYVLPPFQEIHRMENPTGEPTVGIHTYGDAVDECTLFDLDSGQTEELTLSFDHDCTEEFHK